MISETIRLNIDGRLIETQEGKSVLEASLDGGLYIPHLCHHPDLPPIGACRLCVVEIEGMEGLPTSCTTPAANVAILPKLRCKHRNLFTERCILHPSNLDETCRPGLGKTPHGLLDVHASSAISQDG